MNFFNLCVFGNIIVYLLKFKNNFAGNSIHGSQLFTFRDWNISLHILLVFMVAHKKFGVSLVFLPLYLSFCLFFLVLLSILFLYSVYLIFPLWCVVEIFFSGNVKRVLYEFCVWIPNSFCVWLVFCYHFVKESVYSIWCDCCSSYTLSLQVWPLECILYPRLLNNNIHAL